MAHDIDETTGKPAMAYVGEKPWHSLGEKLPEGQPIEVWTKAARLDWQLKRLPAHYVVDGKLRVVNDRFVLTRSDTHAALSVVSGSYQIVQPAEVLEFYRDLVAAYGYTLETAGALNGGRKVWALAKTGRAEHVDKSGIDGLAAYLLLATSCDKSLATTAAFTSVRVVCQNTLFFALQDVSREKRPYVKIAHTRRFDPGHVKRELGLIDEAWSRFIENVRRMAGQQMAPDGARNLFTRLLNSEPEKALTPRAQREVETLTALFDAAPGQELATAKRTLWGALNAVSYYADHVRPAASGERLDSAWFGAGAQLKEKAWRLANELLVSISG